MNKQIDKAANIISPLTLTQGHRGGGLLLKQVIKSKQSD